MLARPGKLLVALLVVVGVSVGMVVTAGVLYQPTVEEVNNSWGTVTRETSEIRTEIVIDNPAPLGVNLGSVGVDYTASMNNLTMATGAERGVSIESGTNTIVLSTELDNGRIPDWWVTHINAGEQTTVTISVTVTLDLPLDTLSIAVPEQNQEITTDVLAPLNSDEDRAVNAFGRTLLTVERTRADWQTATRDRTPMDLSATVENPNPSPIVFSKIGYTIRMNDITVAEGESDEEVVIPPKSTETIETTAVIDNAKLDDWWVTHLRNGEETTMEVEFYAVVEYGGYSRKVPLEFFTYRETIETDVLGTE